MNKTILLLILQRNNTSRPKQNNIEDKRRGVSKTVNPERGVSECGAFFKREYCIRHVSHDNFYDPQNYLTRE